MSILIKGMEMPKRCGECPCFHAENMMYCQAVKADKNKKIIAPYGKPRPEWCPLIPVPAHGRLIDADALIEKVIAKYLEHERKGEFVFADAEIKQDIVDLISDAPTIIPADDSKEE